MRGSFWRGQWAVVVVMGLVLFCGRAFGAGDVVAVRGAVDLAPVARGTTARIGVELKIDPRYHIQSARPADPFIYATRVTVEGDGGITAGAARYPVAEKVPAPPGTTKEAFLEVYSGTVYVLVPVTVAGDAALGVHKVKVAVKSQACDADSCLAPRTKEVEVAVEVVEAGVVGKKNEADFFAAADKQAYAEVAETKPGEAATVAAAASGGELMPVGEELRVIGSRAYAPFNAETYPWYWIVVFALVGGMVLNVMPCVLPVIPLKVLSLVQQAHGDRRLAALHGLTFSAGVIALFVALAVMLRSFGWFYGKQFQSAGFLIGLVLFVVALALSMLGVWTINPPRAVYALDEKLQGKESGTLEYAGAGVKSGASHGSYLGSFANGLMATLLATPCSAPFLGGVLAWALVQPTWVAALALGLVGVGMSLPYLVLAMFPGLLSKVPRAGRWSELLKQGLGIVMIGVAVYLITLIPNATYWVWVMLAGVVVGLVCWGWGQIPSYGMTLRRIWTIRGTVVGLGILGGMVLYMMAGRMTAQEPAMVANEGEWQAFNVALLDKGLAEGRPVVVDWTASWCINCHFLEATVLRTAEVEQAFREKKAVLLRADLTTDNPAAELLNKKLGGEAIPVLAVFSPERPYRPVVMRDSYSRERVVGELRKAGTR